MMHTLRTHLLGLLAMFTLAVSAFEAQPIVSLQQNKFAIGLHLKQLSWQSKMAEQLTTISPSTNKSILTRHGLLPEELDTLLSNSQDAFKTYRQLPLENRQDIVKTAIDLLEQRQENLSKELTEQMGRPIAFTGKEISTAVARARYLLKISSVALKDTDGEAEEGFKRFIRKEPIGPVFIVFAWNVGFCSREVSALTECSTPI